MVFSSENNRFEKNVLFIFAFISFVSLFIINGHIWLYLYFFLWFSIFSLLYIQIYTWLKKRTFIESNQADNNLFSLTLLLFFLTLFFWKIFPIFLTSEELYLVESWDLIKTIFLAISFCIISIAWIYLIKPRMMEKRTIKIFIYKFCKKHTKICSLITRITEIKVPFNIKKRSVVKTVKVSSIIVIIIMIFFQTLFFYPTVTMPVMQIRADNNYNELKRIVNEITLDDANDIEKICSILDWFKKESGQMNNIWSSPILSGYDGNGRINLGYYNPLNFILCMRILGRDNPLWILTSRCGACEEHALLFREMAHAANLPVRSVHCYEGNHCWDEVFLNNSWIIVDPARSKFDVPFEQYKKEFNNPRHVFAEYPNENNFITDVTKNYANITYVNIKTVDIHNRTIPHVEINLFSRNGKQGKNRTDLTFITNETGQYNLSVGMGTIILESSDNHRFLYNETITTYTTTGIHNLTIIMEESQSGFDVALLVLILIYGMVFFYLFFKHINKRRGGKKDMNRIEDNAYFVSFIDVLGFKKLIEENTRFPELEKVNRSMYRLIWGIKEAHRTGESNEFMSFLRPLNGKIPYVDEILSGNVYNFSDSIIFYIKSSNDYEDNIKRLRAICWITNVFIAKSILFGDKTVFELPLRAGIAYGPMSIDEKNKVHIGKPLIDAYNLSNSLDWMGGAIHPSVPEKYIETLIGYDNEIYKYDIPIKRNYLKQEGLSRNDIYHALNWVRQHPSHEDFFPEMRGKKPRPLIKDIGKNHVKKHVWGNRKDNIWKLKNTMKFIKRICDEFDMEELN